MEAIVLIRPERSGTFGNQKQGEVATIVEKLDEVHVDGPTDFRFFKPRH